MGDWKEKENSFSWLTACKKLAQQSPGSVQRLVFGIKHGQLTLPVLSRLKRKRMPRSCLCKDARTSAGLCRSTFNNRIMETIFCFLFSISLLNQSRNLQTRILWSQDTGGEIFTQEKETLYLFSFPPCFGYIEQVTTVLLHTPNIVVPVRGWGQFAKTNETSDLTSVSLTNARKICWF